MKIIDLSIPIEDGLPSDPPIQIPKIQYCNHKDTAEQMAGFFKGCTVDDLPEGNGWGIEFLQVCTHSGTHVDAPYHYYPTMNGGEKAWTIDEVPLDWFIGDGVVMDFHDKPDGYKITAKDVEEYFEKIGYTLKEGDIVLVHTTAQKNWGRKEYLTTGCGVGREATLWLSQQGVHMVGTDAWSWDAPLSLVAERYRETNDPSIIWEGHKAGRECIYFQIEKLNNLDTLPKFGFTFCAFPIKIEKAGAGWCRAVAFLKD